MTLPSEIPVPTLEQYLALYCQAAYKSSSNDLICDLRSNHEGLHFDQEDHVYWVEGKPDPCNCPDCIEEDER